MKRVEAEGGELVLRDELGNIAIIPKYLRSEVNSKLSCGGCITDIVKTLPLNESYADTGTIVTPEIQDDIDIENEFNELANRYSQYGWSALDASEQDKYRALYDIKLGNSAPIVSVKKQKLSDEFTDYYEPEHIQNIKQFQNQYSLKETGVLQDEDRRVLRSTNPDKQAITDYEQIMSSRKAYQNKIKTAGQKYQGGEEFGMRRELYENLKSRNLDVDTKQCIGGVCNFLLSQDDTALSQYYYSNFTFEKNAKKEGWQEYKDTKQAKPEIGDILIHTRRNLTDGGETVSKHAKIIVDYNPEKKEYTVLDNAGKTKARKRTYTEEELFGIINRDLSLMNPKYNFYKRDRYGNKSISQLDANLNQLPREFQPKKYDIDLISVDDNTIPEYTKGVNDVLKDIRYTDIPQEDIVKLSKIVSSIPKNESEYATGTTYKLEAAVPSIAKIARKLKKGTDMDKTLSVGVTQINPQMLPEDIKNKYFYGDSDKKIEKILARNKEIAGKVSMELIMDRYRYLRDRPHLYTNDTSKFWYTLAKSWQSPNYAKSEKGKENIQNLDVQYSENIIKEAKTKKITVTKRS